MANFNIPTFESIMDENANQNLIDLQESHYGASSDGNNNNETVNMTANPETVQEETEDDTDNNDNNDNSDINDNSDNNDNNDDSDNNDETDNKEEKESKDVDYKDIDESSLDSVDTVKKMETDSDDSKSEDERTDDEKTDDANEKTDDEKENDGAKPKCSVFCKIEEFVEEKDGMEEIMFKILENEAARSGPETTDDALKELGMMENSDAEN